MPLSPANAAGIQAGSSLLSSVWNMQQQQETNRLNLIQDERTYRRTRRDAIADRNFENEYNSPAAQMARLKAAGLNPNLVYDSGGAKTASVSTRSADSPRTKFDAPSINFAGFNNSLSSYFENQYREAQTDNVKAATSVARQDAINKYLQSYQIIANTAQSIASTAKTNTDRQAAEQTIRNVTDSFPVTLETMRANLRKINADTAFTLGSNERAAASNAQTIRESVARIIQMRISNAKTQQEINNLKAAESDVLKSAELKQLDINLKKIGVNPSDPQWQRVVGQAVQKYLNNPSGVKAGLKQWSKDAANWFNRNKPSWTK